MALDALGADPCSLLNLTGPYADLWVNVSSSTSPSESSTYPRIVQSGALKTYISYLTTLNSTNNLEGNLLSMSAMKPDSTFNLLQFLSGGGITAGQGFDYRSFKSIVLRPSLTSAPETLVDTYIVGNQGLNKGTSYTYSTNDSPLIKETEFWSPADQTPEGGIVSSPSSLLGKLLAKGYLIQSRQLYNPLEFQPGALPPTPGSESLVYLYKLTQESKTPLTQQQTARKNTLEAINLRFFGAFLAEYCFYRTRYIWLLMKYFEIYTKQGTSGANMYIPPSAGSSAFQLFTGTGTGPTQYQLVNGSLTQTDYLKGLVYHMSCLNTRLTDLRRLLGAINQFYTSLFNQIQNRINDGSLVGSNADLTKKIQALNASSQEAEKYLAETDFKKGVVEYTQEKNRYSNNLLGLYAFLNIAAVAMILQLSK